MKPPRLVGPTVHKIRPRVTLESMQVTDDISLAAIYGWMSGHGEIPTVIGDGRPYGIEFKAPDGRRTVSVHHGGWIIRGVNGKFFPCDAESYERLYEEIPDDE